MKHSVYTHELLLPDDKMLLYNAASGAIVVLDADGLAMYKQAAEPDQGEVSPGLAQDEDAATKTMVLKGAQCSTPFEVLVANGFLVPDDLDEPAEQSRIFRAGQQDRSTLSLCIAPTYACNLRCPYCYEKDHTNTARMMDGAVIDAIVDFVRDVHDRDDFTILDVQWYGGDPSLALDVVGELSSRLMTWADDSGVVYTATMLSNCIAIGPEEVDLLVDCRIREMLITIDGDSDLHNTRRPAADGSDSYAATIGAISLIKDAGINVMAMMNTDKVNAGVYRELHDELQESLGIELMPVKLNDYHQGYGCPGFCKPEFDLFTFPEFARWELGELKASNAPVKQKLAMLDGKLSPFATFCRGQAENYYCIDALGDVYKCDGQMGQPEYIAFSLLRGDADVRALDTATPDPTLDEQCGNCSLLPVCRGNCHWERACCGMPCHPLKYVLDDYLGWYYELWHHEA